MTSAREPILTIGHSTHSFDFFLELLRTHGVTAIADVRSSPFSRANPQYNRKPFADGLRARGIAYVFLGRELGARPNDPSCYLNGRVQYSRLAEAPWFRKGLERVARGSSRHRIALMCAEKEPLECHRTVLVARALHDCGMLVEHILADGRIESHTEAMERLLKLAGLSHEDLFRSKADLIAEALVQQEERIAHVDEKLAAQPPH